MFERLQRPTTTTTPQPPLIERLIRPYLEPWQKQFNEFGKDMGGFMPTTTTTPQPTTTPKENLFAKELEKPILELSNPFKPNPLMSLFTTPLPLSELPAIEKPKLLDMPIPTPTLPAPQYKLQDPFYNPLYPNRKSKLFDVLAGGEAVRLLG
ncbi:hypothetical protein ANCCEY_15786 [Ancylostoma ceylanicum]|uniref:Uncharacterized protein n=1 Tax=Ancylostoma ceylanicum TaxID=53326 RepID=A0A0D6L6L4_9BILA|nr:hypothetical protein ANCCEY_15786 [Ancylostoma ceylanicum]